MKVRTRRLRLSDACTRTPLVRLELRRSGATQPVWLKLELYNPTGSVKYRTAVGLLHALQRQRPFTVDTVVVESTSGNLGVALAGLARPLAYAFVAVVDPKLPPGAAARLRESGARLVAVHDRDKHGGYLLTRLRRVRELLADNPEARWPNQYENPANPGVHRAVTAVELLRQTGGRLNAMMVAVSTGGTLAGISEGIRAAADTPVRVTAVDVDGSLVTSCRAHPHLLTGVGATRRSSFLRPEHYDDVERVTDVQAFAYCRMLAADTGLYLGGSSGAVLAAAAERLRSGRLRAAFPVLLCPDGGNDYRDTIYDDGWLSHRNALVAVRAAVDRARLDGLSMTIGRVR